MKTDTELRRNVADELEWEPSVDAARIGVAAHDGIVTLTGNVKNYAQKLAAERITKRVHGVRAIANDIEVQLPGTAERTDSDIAQAAVDALNWSHSVPEGPVKVTVSKGWITLEGELKWRHQKDAAFESRAPPGRREGSYEPDHLEASGIGDRGQVPHRGCLQARRRAGCGGDPSGDLQWQGNAARRRPLLVGARRGGTDGPGGTGRHPR